MMWWKRVLALLCLGLVCFPGLVGCTSKDEGVDAPLAPIPKGPPPPRPNKPNVSPGAAGGGPGKS